MMEIELAEDMAVLTLPMMTKRPASICLTRWMTVPLEGNGFAFAENKHVRCEVTKFFFRITGDIHLPDGKVFALGADSGRGVCLKKEVNDVPHQIY